MCPKRRFRVRAAPEKPPPETKNRAVSACEGSWRPFYHSEDSEPYAIRFWNKRIFSYLWGRNDPFISRKVLQSHMQFGFGTSAFFSYLCRAIRNSGLSWLVKKSGKFYSKQSSVYPALRCSLRRMARDMIPTSLRRGLYALICFRVFQSLSPNKQTVVRVRIFTGAAQRSPKSTPS